MLNSALQNESRGCSMYIFVTNDTDSLCALRIFTVSGPPLHFKSHVAFEVSPNLCCVEHFAPRRSQVCHIPSFLNYQSQVEISRSRVDVRGKWNLSLMEDVRLTFLEWCRLSQVLFLSTVEAILTFRKNGSTDRNTMQRRTSLTRIDLSTMETSMMRHRKSS